MLVLFPNQLFETLPVTDVALVEDTLFFKDPERPLQFNGLKLAYQRTCMKRYEAYLKQKGYNVEYWDWQPKVMFWRVSNPEFIDPKDHILRRRIKRAYPGAKIWQSPNFMDPEAPTGNFSSFYAACKKKYGLTEPNHDKENRESIHEPFKLFCREKGIRYALPGTTLDEAAIKYVGKFKSPWRGDWQKLKFFATTHKEALQFLRHFIRHRLEYFYYQDAIVETPYVFHSMISAALNIGLLGPNKSCGRS